VNRTIRRSGEPSPEANGRASSFGKLWRQEFRCSMDGFFEGCERFEDRWVRRPTRVTAAEEGKPEALGALQGASGEWQTAENEANLVRQRCKMRELFESRAVAEVRNLEGGDRCAARGGGATL